MTPAVEKPELDQVWTWLHDVPDPEIPVISVTDLGIVRDLEWDEDRLLVTVTPTYSGCPATAVISMDIQTALIFSVRLDPHCGQFSGPPAGVGGAIP